MTIARLLGVATAPRLLLVLYARATRAALTTVPACLGATVLYTLFVAFGPVLALIVSAPRVRRDGG